MSESEFHKIRAKYGYSKDRLELKEGTRIFAPSKQDLFRIEISFGDGVESSDLKDTSKVIVKELALHSNFLGADIRKLMITSTARTPAKQAELMVTLYLNSLKKLFILQ